MADDDRGRTHFYGDGCNAPYGAQCEHLHVTTIGRPIVRCDVCQVRLRRSVDNGVISYEEVQG